MGRLDQGQHRGDWAGGAGRIQDTLSQIMYYDLKISSYRYRNITKFDQTTIN